MNHVYPVYEIGYKKNLFFVLKELDKMKGIFTVGRLGLFNYNNIDHCLDMAKITSEIILKNNGINEWKEARKYFESYEENGHIQVIRDLFRDINMSDFP